MRIRFSSPRLLGSAGLLLLTVFFAVAGCERRSEPGADAQDDPSSTVFLNHAPGVSYVGRDVCAECHADKFETFIHSQMGRSYKRATLSNSAADFTDPSPIYNRERDLYYLPFHEGEDLFVMEYRLEGRDTVFKRVERIDYIVGSGQHTNSHEMVVNGYVYQIPVTYYVQDGRWDLAPQFDKSRARFGRPIVQACMTCHNAMPGFVPGSENRYTHVPEGIDCERCHGPGSLHVERIRAGTIVDVSRQPDPSIVNPARLSPERQIDVCQSCHMQGANVYRPGKTPADFRPGMRLEDMWNVYWPRFTDSTTSFIMASHPDRMRMSPCYQGSHAGTSGQTGAGGLEPMTCTTCHDPHLPIESLTAEQSRQDCLSCHATPQVADCTEDEAVRARVADDCASCHMPTSGSVDIPHIRITDHFIRVVDAGREAQVEPRFVRMAGLVDPSPSAAEMAEAYLTYFEEVGHSYHEGIDGLPGFLDSAAVFLERARVETPEVDLTVPQVRLWFLQREYDRIVGYAGRLSPARLRDGWTWYRVGEAHFQLGRYRDAARYLGLALEHQPQNLRFLNRLATALSSDGQLDAALARFDALLQANPKFEEARNNRGFTRLRMGDLAGAEADFHAALALDPDAEQALANLASLLYNTDRVAEAAPYMRRLLRLRPDHEPYRQLARLIEQSAK